MHLTGSGREESDFNNLVRLRSLQGPVAALHPFSLNEMQLRLLSQPRICYEQNLLSRFPWTRLDSRPTCWISRVGSMKATKLTTAPEGFEYYRICDREGVCQVVRGMWAAQHLTEDIRELSATKTKYSEDWV